MAKRHLAKSLVARLTGISCPIAGVSWTPPTDQQAIARKIVRFLEDRRLLFSPYEMENLGHVTKSVLLTRRKLNTFIEDAPGGTVLEESLKGLCAACRKFLDEIQRERILPSGSDILLAQALGELRGTAGVHIARLGCAYGVEIPQELAKILPADPTENIS